MGIQPQHEERLFVFGRTASHTGHGPGRQGVIAPQEDGQPLAAFSVGSFGYDIYPSGNRTEVADGLVGMMLGGDGRWGQVSKVADLVPKLTQCRFQARDTQGARAHFAPQTRRTFLKRNADQLAKHGASPFPTEESMNVWRIERQ